MVMVWRNAPPPGPPPRAPEGQRIYAVGDIHGRDDLLDELRSTILADARSSARRAGAENTIVYLGDYVDRGPGSFTVIERLINEPLPGFTTIHLMGNHEDMMLRFIEGPPQLTWLMNGGTATLASYGVRTGGAFVYLADLDEVRRALLKAVPPAHLSFLGDLRMAHVMGDYAFVHAGIRPGVAIEEQSPADVMWIRDKFLRSRKDFGKVIVHGHTITAEPEVLANRIGIDTGAFQSNRLTCLVLEGDERRFLHT